VREIRFVATGVGKYFVAMPEPMTTEATFSFLTGQLLCLALRQSRK